jgi:hypothetical protein
MIGPAMFDEFVKPEIVATCEKLPRTVYHLDGVGQLAHLDSLLDIEPLDGVQWVPGDGKPGSAHWPEVFRKIHAAGKRIQIYELDALDAVAGQIGAAAPIHVHVGWDPFDGNAADVQRLLEKYGVE